MQALNMIFDIDGEGRMHVVFSWLSLIRHAAEAITLVGSVENLNLSPIWHVQTVWLVKIQVLTRVLQTLDFIGEIGGSTGGPWAFNNRLTQVGL